MSEDYTHEPNRYEAVLKIELIAMRADLERATVALRGVLDGMTARPLAHSRVGLAVKAGVPHPDIATVDALRQLLIAVPSLCYSRAGASGIFFAGLIERLGIADVVNAKAIVADVTRVLSQRYPEDAEKFAANAAALTSKIDALTAEIEAELAPVKDKPFIVFHDATQYFERRFGLSAAGSVTVSPEVQPSAKRLTAIRKKIAALGAVCVFAEPSFQPKLVEAVTGGTAAKSGTLDPEGASLTPGPDLYFTLMRNLAASLKTCLAS